MKPLFFVFIALPAIISARPSIDDVGDKNGQSFHDIRVTYSQLWKLVETLDERPCKTVLDIYSNGVICIDLIQCASTGLIAENDKFNRENTFKVGSEIMQYIPFMLRSYIKSLMIRNEMLNMEDCFFREVVAPNFTCSDNY